MSKKFTDEGKNHTIDFSKADFATEKMHSDYKLISGSLLKDIDWVATVEGDTVLVEYKNFDRVTPEEFRQKLTGDKVATDIAQKFYDSFLFIALNEKRLTNIRYIFIVEKSGSDSVVRKNLRNKISKKLPFALQLIYEKNIICKFEALSVDEWNNSDIYLKYPITDFSSEIGD